MRQAALALLLVSLAGCAPEAPPTVVVEHGDAPEANQTEPPAQPFSPDPATKAPEGARKPADPQAQPVANPGAKLAWANTVAEGQKLAAKQGKYLLLKFEAEWCGPCQLMKKEAFNDPEVVKLLKDAVIVPVDIDQPSNQALEDKHKVTGVPYLVFAKADGKPFGSIMGYDTPQILAAHIRTELSKR